MFFGSTLKGQNGRGSSDFPVLTDMQKKAPRCYTVVYHKAARQRGLAARCRTPTPLLHSIKRAWAVKMLPNPKPSK